MLSRTGLLVRAVILILVIEMVPPLHASPGTPWSGVLRDAAGSPVGMAAITLVAAENKQEYSTTTTANGQFVFAAIAAGNYKLTVNAGGKIWTATDAVVVQDGITLNG